jgi:hypothetical protein
MEGCTDPRNDASQLATRNGPPGRESGPAAEEGMITLQDMIPFRALSGGNRREIAGMGAVDGHQHQYLRRN